MTHDGFSEPDPGSVSTLTAVAAICLLECAALGYGVETSAESRNTADTRERAGDRQVRPTFTQPGGIDASGLAVAARDKVAWAWPSRRSHGRTGRRG